MKNLLIILLSFTLTSSVCEKYSAEVESIYDGDTMTVDINVGFGIVLNDEKLRIYRIDAPEMRGSEKPQGIISRDALRQLIGDKPITFQNHGRGKYGRIIADIWTSDGTNVSKWMVDNGYAVYKDY